MPTHSHVLSTPRYSSIPVTTFSREDGASLSIPRPESATLGGVVVRSSQTDLAITAEGAWPIMEKPYPQTEETPLIARARRGNTEAFSELVRRHSQQIYGVSLRMLKNHEDAEDNVQNVLCKAFNNIRQFEGNSRFSTWLVRITINEALMKLRKTQTDRAAKSAEVPRPDSNEPLIPDVEDSRPNPERAYIAKDLADKAFHGLHPSLRDTFILHKAEGWTNRELARAMGITVETVKSRIFRARVRMRNQLLTISKDRAIALQA